MNQAVDRKPLPQNLFFNWDDTAPKLLLAVCGGKF